MQIRYGALTNRSLAFKVLSGILAFAVLTASSHIAIPIGPVPITMQTLAVTLTGVLLGPVYGFSITLAWVASGLSGLPVFAFGLNGLAAFSSPTFGYILSFPIIAGFTGLVAGHSGFWRTLAAMLLGNLLCLIIGSAWLAVTIGMTKAWLVGFAPFITGGILKSLLGALLLKGCGLLRK